MTTRHFLPRIAALGFLGLVAACGATPQDDAAAIELVKGSPAARDMLFRECVQDIRGNSPAELANVAAIANTTSAKAPTLVCERVVAAIASGRLAQDDLTKMRRGQITPTLVQVVQGR